MSIFDSQFVQTLINIPVISRVRRNHALEHATLHVLAQRFPHVKMAGHSDTGGFWLLGNLPLEEVRSAVDEAHERLFAGEHNLAVHPNCGTNLAVGGTLAGLAGGIAMLGAGSRVRDKIERLPLAVILATLALIFSRPLGILFQARLTTSGELEDLQVKGIDVSHRGRFNAYRVITQG
ncbi:MAG: DUF6391 domain-containing protein [Anaerolineales bacterium]